MKNDEPGGVPHIGRLDPSHHILVVGAGPCGLFAAKTLIEAGARVTVIESTDRVGGLAAAHSIGENDFELGVHHLHSFDAYVFDEIAGLLGERLRPVEKSALIRFGKGFCRYPLQLPDVFRALGPGATLRCCIGLVAEQLRNRLQPRKPENGEQALIQIYGKALYRLFFESFTHRYWGVHPCDLSAVFVEKKMPRISAFDVVRKALARFGVRGGPLRAVESAIAEETLYYAPTGAHEIYDALAGFIRERGAELRLNAPLERLFADNGRIACASTGDGSDATIEGVDFVISTAPLPALTEALRPEAPSAVLRAAETLHYKPQVVLGLLVRKPRVLDALYVYFREGSFHRVAEPRLSGLDVTPPDHTILVIELTEQVRSDDHARQAELVDEVCRDLAREGLIEGRRDVAEHRFLFASHAYPVYLNGFDYELRTINDYLDGVDNLISTGRQGGFTYPNMHEAMRMGHEAALEAIEQRLRV